MYLSDSTPLLPLLPPLLPWLLLLLLLMMPFTLSYRSLFSLPLSSSFCLCVHLSIFSQNTNHMTARPFRWKPLQYWFKDHLYTDLFVVCGEDSRCLVKNDSPLATFEGSLRLSALDVTSSASIKLNSTTVSLAKGAGAATWLCAGHGSPYDRCESWSEMLERFNVVPTPHKQF